MFKNLRTSTKLLLLCGMFGISVVVTTTALVVEKQIAIAFARKELTGTRYLATVRDIYPAILLHRDDSSFAPPKHNELLNGLAAAEAEAAGHLQTAALEQTFAQTLRELWSDKNIQNTGQLVLMALSSAQKLASRIGDDSNLTLDPDLDTYYMQNIVVERLPALVGQLGEMQTLLRTAIATGSLPREREARLVLLENSIESTADDVKSDIASAYRGNANGTLRRNVDAAIANMTRAYNRTWVQQVRGVAGMKAQDLIQLLSSALFQAPWLVQSKIGRWRRPISIGCSRRESTTSLGSCA